MIKALIIIMACAAIGYGIYTTNVLGVKDLVDPLVSGVASQVGENPLAVAAGVIPTAATVGGLAWKAVSSIKDRSKDEVYDIAKKANTKVNEATGEAAKLQGQVESLQTKIDELENMPNDAASLQQTILEKETTITRLQGGQDSIQNLHDSFVQDLMSKGGNQTIVDPVTKKTYWVLEKPPIIQVL